MAMEQGEILGGDEDLRDPIKERETPAEETQKQLNKEREAEAKVPGRQEELISTPNGIEKDGNTLHVVEKDLEEFVDSTAEVVPLSLPEPLPGEAKPVPEKAPAKSPRAEQIAEKLLRAEKVPERTPRAEKSPAREKMPEPKAARTEKSPRAEKTVRAEKLPEKVRPAAPATPKPLKRKTELRGKDTVPWEGLTLNKCLLVASFVALFSVGCQVFQEFVEYSESVLTAELNAWTSQEGALGELDERWFYERWLDWSDEEEPPEEEEEEEEEAVLEMEEGEEEEEEEEEEPEASETEETEEEAEEVPVSKGRPKKSRERAVKREKVSRGKARRGRELVGKEREEEEEEEEEEEGEETHAHSRQHRREGKLERQHRREVQREERSQRKGRPKAKPDSRDPKAPLRLAPLLAKEGAHKFRRHKAQTGQRHD